MTPFPVKPHPQPVAIMAGLDSPTTTDRSLQPDSESLRHVHGKTLGIKRSCPEYQTGDLEVLRSLRKVLRGAVTMLLKAATELRQAPLPSPSDLLGAINELILKGGELNDLNETIGEILEGDEF